MEDSRITAPNAAESTGDPVRPLQPLFGQVPTWVLVRSEPKPARPQARPSAKPTVSITRRLGAVAGHHLGRRAELLAEEERREELYAKVLELMRNAFATP